MYSAPDRGGVAALAVVAVVAALAAGPGPAHAGVAPPNPNALKPEDIDPKTFTGDQIFNIAFPMKPHAGKLAVCSICGKPLKDHDDPGFVCQDPDRPGVRLARTRAGCPVCGHTFEAVPPVRDPRGGIDYDFCRHPRGVYTVASEIWLCAKCGYAALHWDFGRPVDEKVKRFVSEKVTPETKANLARLMPFKPEVFKLEDFTFLSQKDIPEYLKYENAIAIGRDGHASDRLMSRLHLGASHAYRRLASKPFTGTGLDRAIRRVEALLMDPLLSEEKDAASLAEAAERVLRRADSKKARSVEKLRPQERFYLLVRLAGLHDRVGSPWLSKKCMVEAMELVKEEKDKEARKLYRVKDEEARKLYRVKDEEARKLYRVIVAQTWAYLDLELAHRKKATGYMRKALASGDVPAAERLLSIYLVGELLLRNGEPEKALPWLQAAASLAEGATDPDPDRREKLSIWSRWRLRAPVFYDKAPDAAEAELIAPDAAEKAIVDRIAAGTSGSALRRTEGAAGAAVELARPPAPEDTGRPGRVAARDGAPDAPPERAEAPPAKVSCRERMELIWKAVKSYAGARGSFPGRIEDVIGAGLLTLEETGGMKCPESGHRLFYMPPSAGAGSKAFILYHNDPKRCPCKNMLMSDGSITQFGR